MLEAEVAESKALISSILTQAINDATGFRKPKKPKFSKVYVKYQRKDKHKNPNYVSSNKEYLAWDARRFLSDKNELFCIYCYLLDIDPKYLAEKIAKGIKLFDKGKKNILRNNRNYIDITKVNTLC